MLVSMSSDAHAQQNDVDKGFLSETLDSTHQVDRSSGRAALYLAKAETGQATKGAWWMPRHREAKKDVTTCDKPGGAGRERRSLDFRMGQPGGHNGPSSCTEYIGV